MNNGEYVTHVPAEPKWYLVKPLFKDGVCYLLHYEPVIAWLITTSSHIKKDETKVRPVTVEGTPEDSKDIFLQSPFGRLYMVGGETLVGTHEEIHQYFTKRKNDKNS